MRFEQPNLVIDLYTATIAHATDRRSIPQADWDRVKVFVPQRQRGAVSCYHVHQPWDIPTSLVDIFALSYPSRRFQSAWMGIIVHSAQSVVILIVVFTLVLD